MRPLCAAALAVLGLAGCASQAPRSPQADLPGGQTVVRDGLAAGGERLVAIDGAAACRAPVMWHRAGAAWVEGARGAALPEADCPAVTAMLAADARTLAVYDFSAGRAEVWTLVDGRFEPAGSASLTAAAGFPFPAPGPNLAFSADAGTLLLGSLNRACRQPAPNVRACGTAELFVRQGDHWAAVATFLPAPERDGRIRFGQAVALTPMGDLALVGGTGEPGRSGALWVYALGGDAPRLVQILSPPKPEGGFANDLSLAADGSWLAVGGEQAVYLYQRNGENFIFRRKLTPPDLAAGHFGETVALSADGGRLLVGAPRTACAAGERCGIAYLFERDRYWQPTRTIRADHPRQDANFGHHLALSPEGTRAAVQGAVLHVIALDDAG